MNKIKHGSIGSVCYEGVDTRKKVYVCPDIKMLKLECIVGGGASRALDGGSTKKA